MTPPARLCRRCENDQHDICTGQVYAWIPNPGYRPDRGGSIGQWDLAPCACDCAQDRLC